MSTEQHARTKAAFFAAVELQSAERATFLARLRSEDAALADEVARMLAVDERASGFLNELPAVPALAPLPESIGPFRVVREIGIGGMGTVYEAEQQRPHRRVALKVLEAGLLSPSFVRRFEFEGELLARLSHVGIAQVFETGTAPGPFGAQPYIAMELVAGLPLTRYAAERGADRRERIQLVARVADAVEHAHRRGVVHRDLKPGNILVDAEGQPKVLDFGIGRALDAQNERRTLATEAGQILGTLQYMSPEQALGAGEAIDLRADVYALGVLLYELLADVLPYETAHKPLHAALHTVITAEPVPLSFRDRTLAGDLGTIVAKALEKQPERRYDSAGALAADLRRFLAHEPILAQPATRLYRLKKFTRRNRVFVAGAAATFVALVLGLAGTSWQARVARAGEQRARDEAETAQAILQHLLLDGIAAVDPRELGPRATAKDVFAHVERNLAGTFTDRPAVEAAVRDALGSIWRALGAPERAEPLLVRALELRRTLAGDDDPRTLDTLEHLSACRADLGQHAEALALCEDLYARRRKVLGERDPATLVALNDLGVALWHAGRTDEALVHIREAVRLRTLVLGPTDDKTLSSQNNLGVQLQVAGQLEEGHAVLKAALAARRAKLPDDHPDVLLVRANVARSLEQLGKLDEAETTWRELLAGFERAYGADHPQVAYPLQGLASALDAQDRAPEESEALHRRAVQLLLGAFGESHRDVQGAVNELARFLERHGRAHEAVELMQVQIEVQRRAWPGGHPALVIGLNFLGQSLRRAGRRDEALATFESAIAMARANADVPPDALSQCLYNTGVLLRQDLARPLDAAPLLAEALALDSRVYAPGHDVLAGDLFHLSSALLDGGRAVEAEPHMRTLLAPPYDLGPADGRTAGRLRSLGACLSALGRRDEAQRELERAVACAEVAYGCEDRRTRAARDELERVRAPAEVR